MTIAKQRIENLLSNIFSIPLWEEIESNSSTEKDTEDKDLDKDREVLEKIQYIPASK